MDSTRIIVDGVSVAYRLTLDNSDPVKCRNWLFALSVPNTKPGLDLAQRFQDACYRMPRATRWFHQGGASSNGQAGTWSMFEFWSSDQDAILDAVLGVCAETGLSVQFGEMTSADLAELRTAA